MCGIAGIWGQDDQAGVERMIARLAHRGPDAAGLHRQPRRGVLGHRRLSIMDPTGGDQPLYNETGDAAIVANGEIYNFPRLRADLAAEHTFRTGNDSEAVLHLFEDQGTAAMSQLDGMFAVAVADGSDLVLARDPLGIKPLYLGWVNDGNGEMDTVWFASELKAMTGIPNLEVAEFPPGSWFHSRQGLRSYWRLPEHEVIDEPEAIGAARLRTALEAAVTKRLMSDVPVGAFLSGGLDSSIICAIARQHLDELHTFSVGLEGSPDILAARRVAEHLDTLHHEYLYSADEVIEKLPEILYHLESFDQDLVRSAIPCYFCSRLAAEHVKVILTGEGADELFAGYTYYKDLPADELHDELHRSIRALHNINLQRVDRLTMAHGLEGRVPFLDLELIEVGLSLPPEQKLRVMPDGRKVEKYILRRACDDLLPDDIVWRDKAQFDEGSGTVDLLEATLDQHLRGFNGGHYRYTHSEDRLRSAEEAYYHKTLADLFDGSRVILGNVARWTDRDQASVSAWRTPLSPVREHRA